MKLVRTMSALPLLVALCVSTMSLDMPENPPVPEQRPDDLAPTAADDEAKAAEPAEEVAEPKAPADPAPPMEDDGAFSRCTAALTALGVEYEVLETIDDPGRCGVGRPLNVIMALEGVPLEPAGTMRCKTALSLARWLSGYVGPSAEIAFGSGTKLTEVRQASTYICRNRNSRSDGKISEHAKGNAVDIRSLTFSNGETVDMVPRKEDGSFTGAFQRTASASACLFFSTVLSPGSDATHQDHMHLDVIERSRGYRYCR
nr:extensin family protein [Marinicella sp. W31]MDC2875794.1 extensin family protein [Marinicella sp. W31]